MYDANLLTSELWHKQWYLFWFSNYKLGVEFLCESRLKNLYNKNWIWDQIFYKSCSVFNEKTTTILPPTSPLKVHHVYIKNNINNNEISQQYPR